MLDREEKRIYRICELLQWHFVCLPPAVKPLTVAPVVDLWDFLMVPGSPAGLPKCHEALKSPEKFMKWHRLWNPGIPTCRPQVTMSSSHSNSIPKHLCRCCCRCTRARAKSRGNHCKSRSHPCLAPEKFVSALFLTIPTLSSVQDTCRHRLAAAHQKFTQPAAPVDRKPGDEDGLYALLSDVDRIRFYIRWAQLTEIESETGSSDIWTLPTPFIHVKQSRRVQNSTVTER